MISPCINILRQLVSQFHDSLGSHQGSKHAEVDLSDDIRDLMESLSSNNVYEYHSTGRFIEDSNGKLGIVRDVYTTGLEQLPTSIASYNEQFRSIQARHALQPLTSVRSHTTIRNTNSFCI